MAAPDRTRLIGPLRSFFWSIFFWYPLSTSQSSPVVCFVLSIESGGDPAKHHKEAVRMPSFVVFSLLAAVALSSGCASTPRPQPLVRSSPTDKKRDTATDPSNATVVVEQANETSSSTSLSSRFTKLFSRQDSSDRMPLPRSDQPPGSGAGADSSRQDLGRDF
jgi:hypothetical protein